MTGVLVVAEHRDGEVREVTFELITAAAELKAAGAGPLAVAVLGHDLDQLANSVNVGGVDEVIQVPLPTQEFDSDSYRHALTSLLKERLPRVTLLGFGVDGMSYGPAVAASLQSGFASDVVACAYGGDQVTAVREFYAGKVQAELEFPDKAGVVLMLRPTVWPRASGPGVADRKVHELPLEGPPPRTRHREYFRPVTSDIDITSADFILAVGRGIGDKENLPRFEQLAIRLGATLACSRPLVDSGWLPQARQVGQSGRTVKPKVYLAMGISGAVQHLAGMRASGTIIAVNTDPDAAMFKVAHYGAVADLMEVAEQLESIS